MSRPKKRAAATPKSIPAALPEVAHDAWRGPATLMVITAIGVLLRLIYLNQPMRYDESVTYMFFVRLPLWQAISNYAYPNNHVFHTLLVKLAVGVFGNVPWVLRLPAFFAGVLTIPVTYLATRELYRERVALVAAALVAGSGVLTLYSTNARGYALVVLGTMLLIWLASIAGRRNDPRHWVAFAVVGAMGLWTIPIMLYPLGGVATWFICVTWRDRAQSGLPATRRLIGSALVATVGAGLLGLVLYLPVITHSGLQPLIGNKFVAPSPFDQFIVAVPGGIVETIKLYCLGGGPILLVLLIVLLAAGIFWHRGFTQRTVPLLAVMLGWSAVLLLATHKWPYVRVFLYLLPLLYMVAAVGFVAILGALVADKGREAKFTSGGAILLVLCMASLTVFSHAVSRSDETGAFVAAAEIVRGMKDGLQPGDRVLAPIPTNGPISYWMDRLGVDSMYLSNDPRRAHHHFIVVNKQAGETVEGQLQYLGLTDTTLFTRPKVVVDTPNGSVVRVGYVALDGRP